MVYQEAIPVEQVVRRMADNKQYFTMHGGVRPYGVSIIYAGWDKHLGFQLYQVNFALNSRTILRNENEITYYYRAILPETTVDGKLLVSEIIVNRPLAC